MGFCYIDDSGNQMYLRIIAQPVLSDYSDVARLEDIGVFDSNKLALKYWNAVSYNYCNFNSV